MCNQSTGLSSVYRTTKPTITLKFTDPLSTAAPVDPDSGNTLVAPLAFAVEFRKPDSTTDSFPHTNPMIESVSTGIYRIDGYVFTQVGYYKIVASAELSGGGSSLHVIDVLVKDV